MSDTHSKKLQINHRYLCSLRHLIRGTRTKYLTSQHVDNLLTKLTIFFTKIDNCFRVWQLLTNLTISDQLVNMLCKVEYGGQPSWRSQGCLMILIMEINIVLWMYWLWWLYGNYDDHDDFDDYDDFDFDYININKVEWFANILMRRTFAEGCNFKTFFTQDFCCNAKAYRIHALANLKCFRYFRKMPALCQNIKIWFQHVIHYFEEKKN